MARALTNVNVDETVDIRTREILITALDDNPLRAIKRCKSTKRACDKLQTRHSSKSTITINKLSALSLKMRLNIGTGMANHLSMMKAKFSRLASTDSDVSK